jgi:hypothetical protein
VRFFWAIPIGACRFWLVYFWAALMLAWSATFAYGQTPTDIGWPRVFTKDSKQLTVYQPQVDSWTDYTKIHFRCAVSVKGVLAEEKFGVAEVDATTVVDHSTRTVAIVPTKREVRFGQVTEAEATALRAAVEQLHPSTNVTAITLDRVLAYVDAAKQALQRKAEINLEPPKIFYSATPAVLVILMGQPRLKSIEADRTDLMFVDNTNWDILYDTASKQYYLLDGDGWLTTTDLLKGHWSPATQVPLSFSAIPADANWADARRCVPGKPAKAAPAVMVTTEPAELIVTAGVPQFSPIPSTRLMRVANSESVVFLNTLDGKYYFLVAGRWFRGGSMNGPWSAASKDLPAEFAKIPDGDPSEFVKASVPGTEEAQDAVMLASIPKTIAINMAEAKPVQVTYSGQPQFVAVEGATGVQYAANSPYTVFLVNGGYYCCFQGMWFNSTTANGPWTFCSAVPQPIYTIPPSHPTYNVTYVTVQSTTPTTVVYSQTSGYSGEYVAATGVLMFGAGMLVGAAIANNNNDYYYPPYATHYSYGCGATYRYGYGGYQSAAYARYGPYGGAGYATAYNPATGTYRRAAGAYGPYGAAGAKVAYNPYTGGYAAAAGVTTPYGSAGRAAGYNPNTGTFGRVAGVSGQYGSAVAGGAYNSRTGKAVVGGAVSGENGSAGAVRTNQGSGMVAWDTENGQGAVRKTQSGDIYASNGDTVYKKDSNGGWSSNSGSGWETASKPDKNTSSPSANSAQPQRPSANPSVTSAQPQRPSANPSVTSAQPQRPSASQDMESQAKAREKGNKRTQSATRDQASRASSASSDSGSGSRSGTRSSGGSRGGRSR